MRLRSRGLDGGSLQHGPPTGEGSPRKTTTSDKGAKSLLPRVSEKDLDQLDKPDTNTSSQTCKQPRRIPQDRDQDLLPRVQKRARLTEKNLSRFNKTEKTRGPNPTLSGPASDSASSSECLSTTAPGFALRAYRNGILLTSQSKPPDNIEELRDSFAAPRESPSPPASEYERYVRRVQKARNEATMLVATSGMLLKDAPADTFNNCYNQAFTGFPKDAPFNQGLSAPQPDFVEGPMLDAYSPFPVDEHVPGSVLYKDDPMSITLPHLAGEWKGPEGLMKEAELQCAYDGAALVYGRTQARAYMGQSEEPGHAAVTTFSTDGINLNQYAHYITTPAAAEQAPAGQPALPAKYHQYLVRATTLTSTRDEYSQGRRSLRNQQEYAREQSTALMGQLKDHWTGHDSTVNVDTEGDFNEASYGEAAAETPIEEPQNWLPGSPAKKRKAKCGLEPQNDSSRPLKSSRQ
ncbi:hypothetical protein F503_00470 [Ophiostoma piceae UAMH 11346]|uniref:Heterokaryon incompatibility protein n=1 Tax=Ophiostoma piceae (strain UAMH 11346) TaxID=1262450 RepID=S3CMM1_OPHP1|nr:hypothetical protein F503_00470 [Ophiostoma piceae UAMH 11346]